MDFIREKHKVVIIGGGFGGLQAALAFKKGLVEATLVDRRNFHLFQPLLYQVATGSLSPANIATPFRRILKRRPNIHVLMGEVMNIDVVKKLVLLKEGELSYDTLIVAAGSTHHYFGHDGWARFAPGLKTIEDATEIRKKVLTAFEKAEGVNDAEEVRTWLTFVVVGAGPTGVELAGALGEIARDALKNEFKSIDPSFLKIILVEGEARILQPYIPKLSRKAEEKLSHIGVTCRLKNLVIGVEKGALTIQEGNKTERIKTHTILWAAGIMASPLTAILSERTGATLDRFQRLAVEADLTLPGHPEIFVIGDMAALTDASSKILPSTAPVAIQEGKYVARLIQKRLDGKTIQPFSYNDKGQMVTVGRTSAVAEIGRLNLWGYPAWLLWLLVHLLQLVEFENRLLVLIQWAWSYFTRNRSAGLITGKDND